MEGQGSSAPGSFDTPGEVIIQLWFSGLGIFRKHRPWQFVHTSTSYLKRKRHSEGASGAHSSPLSPSNRRALLARSCAGVRAGIWVGWQPRLTCGAVHVVEAQMLVWSLAVLSETWAPAFHISMASSKAGLRGVSQL